MAIFAIASLGAFAASAASAATLPPQGTFEDCSLDAEMSTCLQRLEVIHQGGLQVVALPVFYNSLPALAEYATAAQQLGMSVMWETSDSGWWTNSSAGTQMDGEYPQFATACGCTNNAALLSYMIHWLGALPATYGYYAADDSALGPGEQDAVKAYVDQIKQADPSHTVMIGSADEQQSGDYQGASDLIGTEIYPVTNSPLMPVASNQDAWGGVQQSVQDAQSLANSDGKQSAFILQAFTWGDNIWDGQAIGVCTSADTQESCYQKLSYPSEAEQVQLRNEVLLHAHPKLILWFSFYGTYGQAGDSTSSIFPTGSVAASRWAGLTAAVNAPAPGLTPNIVTRKAPARAHVAVAARAASVKHVKRHRKHHRRRRHHRKHRTRHTARA